MKTRLLLPLLYMKKKKTFPKFLQVKLAPGE